LTQSDTPWNPSSFSVQVSDNFYHQVIDDEQKNSLNTKSDYSCDIKFVLVEQKQTYVVIFCLVNRKHANIVFHFDTIVMKNNNDINQLGKDSFYRKALPAKIEQLTSTMKNLFFIPFTMQFIHLLFHLTRVLI
jgi:hypothetical protein